MKQRHYTQCRIQRFSASALTGTIAKELRTQGQMARCGTEKILRGSCIQNREGTQCEGTLQGPKKYIRRNQRDYLGWNQEEIYGQLKKTQEGDIGRNWGKGKGTEEIILAEIWEDIERNWKSLGSNQGSYKILPSSISHFSGFIIEDDFQFLHRSSFILSVRILYNLAQINLEGSGKKTQEEI